MNMRFVPADGVYDIETGHVRKTNVNDSQAEIASVCRLDSVPPSQRYRHTITCILKNHPERIGHTWFILNDEDSAFLFFPLFSHKRLPAILMPCVFVPFRGFLSGSRHQHRPVIQKCSSSGIAVAGGT
jgi:hypothetical protein